MSVIILFIVKSMGLLGAALLVTSNRYPASWLTAAQRHLVLVTALASLPVLIVLAVLPQMSLPVESPQVLRQLDLWFVAPPAFAVPTGAETVGVAQGRAFAWYTWAIGGYALVVLGLLLMGLAKLVRIAHWRRSCGDTAVTLKVVDGVRVVQTPAVNAPITWGILNPEIIVPLSWSRWGLQKQQVVIAHELAHVRRRDVFTEVVGGCICAIFWVHPLAWVVQRRMQLEAEKACDDSVVLSGVDALAYAHLLVEVARAHRTSFAPAMAAEPTIPARIRALLNVRTRRTSMTMNRSLSTLALTLAVILPLGAVAPATNFEFSSDGDLFPRAKVAPIYPLQALEAQIEGHVLVEFTVTKTGTVVHPLVIEAQPPGIFEAAAINAVRKFLYTPRVEEGIAVEVSGIRNKVSFKLPATAATPAIAAADKLMRRPVRASLLQAQTLIAADELPRALAYLDELLAAAADLNPAELQQLHNMRGYLFYSQAKYPAAITEFEQVLAKGDQVDAGLRAITLFTLAQLDYVVEDYAKALVRMQLWIDETGYAVPQPQIFMSQVHYQLGDYAHAIEAMEAGIRLAQNNDVKVRENWWGLLQHLYYEQENWSKAIEVLETLQHEYPDAKYLTRLAHARDQISL